MSDVDHDDEFAGFFRAHNRRLRGYLKKSLKAPDDLVDEAAMRAFMAVRRHWARLRTQNPKAYLFAVGQREVGKRIAGYREQPVSTDLTEIEVPDPHDHVDRLINQVTLQLLVQELPHHLQQTVTLRHIEGFSVEETATIMGVRPGTVKRYTSDALAALKELAARGDSGVATNEEVHDR